MNTSIKEAVRLALALSAAALIAPAAGVHAQEQSTAVAEGVTEEVIVLGRQRSAASDVIQERINQEVVVDLLGAEQISRVGDSTVSLALRRLPGVTLVSDQFIYVRGLGERYSSTTLNGAMVPSPDLTRNVIPLDMFPAEIIESLAIHKGYTADMPAAFGGGNVDIRTTGIPDRFVFDFQVGSGWNSNGSSRALSYRGGGDDWLGTDDGTRELSPQIRAAIQTYRGNLSPGGIRQVLNRDGQTHTLAEAQQINRELATSVYRDIDFREGRSDPDISAEATLGNSWYFGDEERWRFGAIGLIDYGNLTRERNLFTQSAGNPGVDFENSRRTTNQVSLTGSLNLGLEYGDDHRLEMTGMYLRNTDDEATLRTGNDINFRRIDGRQLRSYYIRYEERDLELYQVRGSHTLGDDTLELLGLFDAGPLQLARDLNFAWYYSDATAQTEIPNQITISALDTVNPQTGALVSTSIRPQSSAADIRFTELDDKVKSYGWQLSKPFTLGRTTLTFSGGQDQYQKGRSYLETQLAIGTTTAPAGALVGTPGQVFSDANILDPANGFALSLRGIGTESYLAAERVDASFGKFDLNWDDRWRLSGGVRWENFRQIAVPVDPYQYNVNIPKVRVPADVLPSLVKNEDDYYPSLALTYKARDFWAQDFQLRLGWSETVARPDLREISPTVYIDPLNQARVQGNPDLVVATLMNLDLRAEWFFGSGDNFTVSLFYKDIGKPIETVQGGGTDNDLTLTFINAQSAEMYGVEVEWLKSLGFLERPVGAWTDAFFIAGNLTWSDSEIIVGPQAVVLTSPTRRMTQHAEYVANVQFGFDAPNRMHGATLVYNFVGERLWFAGTQGAADAYEQPFHSLDLVYSFYPTDLMSLKLRLQNLLDTKTRIERAGVTTREQGLGTTVKLDVAFKF